MNFDLVSYLRTNPVIAIVGATNDTTKYGNKIMKDLIKKGYRVVPINPKATEVEGIKAYPDLTSAKSDHDISMIDYVIPPALTLKSLEEAKKTGIKKVWIQPGAGNDEVRDYLELNGFEYLMDACVMIESRQI